MKKQNIDDVVDEVKSILLIVVEFQETYGFEDFDYGYLLSENKWECSFFKKVEDDEPSLYFLTDTIEELIYKLKNY